MSTLDQRARRVIEERSTDPERLRQEVDLVRYAEFCGYRVNHTESTEDVDVDNMKDGLSNLHSVD